MGAHSSTSLTTCGSSEDKADPGKIREDFFNRGREVRLAYASDSIGLYRHLSSLTAGNKVVDIAAFGDRMVAAAAVGFDYHGVDPDVNLAVGLSRLRNDLLSETHGNNTLEIDYLPLEGVDYTEESIDVVTYSPPPFTMERYAGGSEYQTHSVYPDVDSWFNGFIVEILNRAGRWLRDDGILAFSALDRREIRYVERMILYACSVGFRPLEIYTLSSSSGTPWWIFRKDKTYRSNDYLHFYPQTTDLIGVNPLAYEYVRHNAVRYMIRSLAESDRKIERNICRVLMSKIPGGRDPVLPTAVDEVVDDPILEYHHLYNSRYVLSTPDGNYMRRTLGWINLSKAVVDYLRWIVNTKGYQTFARSLDEYGRISHSQRNNVIRFLREMTLHTGIDLNFPHNGVSLPFTDYDNLLSEVRYSSLGPIEGHHYTRNLDRIRYFEKITGRPVVDGFATPWNKNSSLYYSVYPDVDRNSLGNYRTAVPDKNYAYMFNPPPYDGFNEVFADRLVDVYLQDGYTVFYSTTVWKDGEGMEIIESLRRGEFPSLKGKDPQYSVLRDLLGLSSVSHVYLLDEDRIESRDGHGRVVTKSAKRQTESLGIVFNGDPKWDLQPISRHVFIL